MALNISFLLTNLPGNDNGKYLIRQNSSPFKSHNKLIPRLHGTNLGLGLSVKGYMRSSET